MAKFYSSTPPIKNPVLRWASNAVCAVFGRILLVFFYVLVLIGRVWVDCIDTANRPPPSDLKKK